MDDLEGVIVTAQDCRCISFCRPGTQAFMRRHGIDWMDFLQNGVPASRLAEIGDAMADEVVTEAVRRTKGLDNNG